MEEFFSFLELKLDTFNSFKVIFFCQILLLKPIQLQTK